MTPAMTPNFLASRFQNQYPFMMPPQFQNPGTTAPPPPLGVNPVGGPGPSMLPQNGGQMPPQFNPVGGPGPSSLPPGGPGAPPFTPNALAMRSGQMPQRPGMASTL